MSVVRLDGILVAGYYWSADGSYAHVSGTILSAAKPTYTYDG